MGSDNGALLSEIHIDTMLALRKAYFKLRQRYENDSRTKKFNGYEVFILITASEPTTPKRFAELLSCKPAQITGYVSKLESLNYLKREISQDDKRSFSFKLTDLGKEKSREFFNTTKEIYSQSSGLTVSENKTLVSLLKKL
jgi:DNA-binding MarR family transcriptional regulator